MEFFLSIIFVMIPVAGFISVYGGYYLSGKGFLKSVARFIIGAALFPITYAMMIG